MSEIAGLPWQAWAALLPLAGGGVAALYKWSTSPARLVDLLRKALDKGRIRENALASVVELLIFAIDHVESPSAAVLALRARAADVLEQAHRHLQDINGGSKE